MNYFAIILMAQAPSTTSGAQAQGSPFGMFIPLIAVMVIFWLFMIRPQAKRQKELRKFRDSLQKGDKVITTGGIYGKVTAVKEHILVLQVDENTNITVDKASVLKDSTDLQQQK